jgi:hypothetical protein
VVVRATGTSETYPVEHIRRVRMKKSEMAGLIDKLAEELAASGKYSNALSVEHALKDQGYKNVRSLLGDFRRRELDEICRQAQEQNNKNGG